VLPRLANPDPADLGIRHGGIMRLAAHWPRRGRHWEDRVAATQPWDTAMNQTSGPVATGYEGEVAHSLDAATSGPERPQAQVTRLVDGDGGLQISFKTASFPNC
jgi:hypothetical protein